MPRFMSDLSHKERVARDVSRAEGKRADNYRAKYFALRKELREFIKAGGKVSPRLEQMSGRRK